MILLGLILLAFAIIAYWIYTADHYDPEEMPFSFGRQYFRIDGYWLGDDNAGFCNYLVTDYDDAHLDDDDMIFYYGLSEAEIIEAIKLGEDSVHPFVITNYRKEPNYGKY